MKQKQTMSQDINGNGILTIKEGEIPVINACTDNLGKYAPAVVNFLRCGCPKVQIYTQYKDEDQKVHLITTLKLLELEEETLSVSGDLPVFIIERKLYK